MTDRYNFSYYANQSEDGNRVKKARQLTSMVEDTLESQRERQENYWDQIHPREATTHYESPFSSAVQDFLSVVFDTDGDRNRAEAELAMPKENIPESLPDPMGEASVRFARQLNEDTPDIENPQSVGDPEELPEDILLEWLQEFFVYSERYRDWPHPAGVVTEARISSEQGYPIDDIDVELLYEVVNSGEATNHTFRIISKLALEAPSEFIDLAGSLEIELAQLYEAERFDIGLLSLVETFGCLAREFPDIVVQNHTDGIRQLIRIGGDSEVQAETRIQALQAIVSLARGIESSQKLIHSEIESIRAALASDNPKIAREACNVVTQCRASDEILESPIRNLLQDSDMDTVLAARRAYATLSGNESRAKSLIDFDTEQSIDELMRKLGSREPLVRLHAARTLEKHEKAISVTKAVKYLDDPDGDVRACLCGILLDSNLENESTDLLEQISGTVYANLNSPYTRQESYRNHIGLLREVLFVDRDAAVDGINDSPFDLFEALGLLDEEENIGDRADVFAAYSERYIRRLDPENREPAADQVFELFGEILSKSEPDETHRYQIFNNAFVILNYGRVPPIKSEQLFEYVAASAEINPSETLTAESAFQHHTRSSAVQVLSVIAISTSDQTILPTIFEALAHTRYVYDRYMQRDKTSEDSGYGLITNALIETVIAVRLLAASDEGFQIPEGTRDTLVQSVNIDNKRVVREVVETLGCIGGEEAHRCLREVAEDPDQTTMIRRLASKAVSNR